MNTLIAGRIPTRTHILDKLGLVRHIWPQLPQYEWQEKQYVSLLQHFESQYNELSYTPTTTMKELFQLLGFLKNNVAVPRTTFLDFLKGELQQKHISLDGVDKLTEFLVRSWLTMNITISPGPPRFPPQVSVVWDEGQSLQTVVEDKFQALKNNGGSYAKESTIPTHFTIPNLINNYRWTVLWTNNLVDHLMIERRESGNIVTIYEHKICLHNHLQYGEDCLIPIDALSEALDTLNLLFPPNDQATQRYLQAQHRPFHELGLCRGEIFRDLQHYRYWQSNIADLLGDLKEQPQGFMQLRLDKNHRNLLQFATFWIAVMVALLTVLSIAFGAVSTVYAVKQYNLALAQACSTPGAAAILPRYCL